MLNLRYVAVALWAKNSIGRSSKSVQYLKTYIVAGIGIIRTNIPEPGN
jgi:hypothetical protein